MTSTPTWQLPENLRSRPVDILALGNAKLEMIVHVAAWPDGWGQQDTNIPLPIYSAGGCATNVACVAARLGGKALLTCRIGDGRYSQPVVAELAESGVDPSGLIYMPDAEGNLLIITTNSAGDWTVLSYQDPALLLQPEDIPPGESFASTKILHIDGFSFADAPQKKAVELAITRAHENGCLVSVDAAVPTAKSQPEYLASLFTRCDIIFANLAEAKAITRASDLDEVILGLRALGPTLSSLKMGASGSVLITPDKTVSIPAFPIDVVDTLAAGDSYIAAMLTGLCQGLPLSESATWGSAAGALACRGAGSLTNRFALPDILALISNRAA